MRDSDVAPSARLRPIRSYSILGAYACQMRWMQVPRESATAVLGFREECNGVTRMVRDAEEMD